MPVTVQQLKQNETGGGKENICVNLGLYNVDVLSLFQQPVINVFSIPDAPELVCVTLGQLEIREVRRV